MSHREKKQPWNAFPLAVLSIRKLVPDISPCAANILQYLATRSDYMGTTIVGQRRIAEDIIRSKDYVTAGMKELVERKLVRSVGRKRSDKQADRHIISPTVLGQEHRDILTKDKDYQRFNNPAEQEDWDSNDPARQEDDNPAVPFNNPAQQDETSSLNLAEEPNLAVEDQKQLASKLVSYASPKAGEATGSASPSLSGTPQKQQEPTGSLPTEQSNPIPAWDLPCWYVIHEEFGEETCCDEAVARTIHMTMVWHQMDANELRSLLRWAWQHKFWKTRIISFEALAKAMERGISENGSAEKSLVAQFRRDKHTLVHKQEAAARAAKGEQAQRQ